MQKKIQLKQGSCLLAFFLLGAAVAPAEEIGNSEVQEPERKLEATALADGFYLQLARLSLYPSADALAEVGRAIDARNLHVRITPEHPSPFTIVYGPFEFYADAYVESLSLRENGQDSFIVRLSGEGGRSAESSFITPLAEQFRPVASQAEILRSATETASFRTANRSLLVPGDRTQSTLNIGQRLNSLDPADPEAGYLLQLRGSILLRELAFEEALSDMKQILDGRVAATEEDYRSALRMAGWLHHRLGDRVTAYTHFRNGFDRSAGARIQEDFAVEKLGAMFELADSAKGTHADARRAMQDFLANHEFQSLQNRAVVELMYAETYVRQPGRNYAMAVRLAEDFLTRWEPFKEEVMREYVTMKVQLGWWYYFDHRTDDALKIYEVILRDYSDPDIPHFYMKHPAVTALMGQVFVLADEGRTSEIFEIYRDILRFHPESHAARWLNRIYPSGLLNNTGTTISVLERN